MNRRRGAVDILLPVCFLLVLTGAGAGVWAWMLQQEAGTVERQLGQAEKDLKAVVGLRDDLRDIRNSGGAASGSSEIDTIQTFFHDTAKEHRFTITRIAPSNTIYRSTWTEQSYRLEIKNVTRQQLGNFIADVELKKPFLKSKEIRDVKFDEQHSIQTVAVVFSHYQRIRK
ncbi:MAG: hypothetical protein IT452_19590 [Planctomycetia bacterium]|nr:hypothetical protein [Planctomycetia bacterium]